MALRPAVAVVGVHKEATPYTYNQPVAAECFPAFDVSWTPSAEMYERTESRTIMDKLDLIPGTATMEISFKILLVGQHGGAGTVPYWDDAIMCCGFRETVTAGTSVAYTPWTTMDAATDAGPPATTNPFEAASVAVFEDGNVYAASGCMGNVTFTMTAGQPAVMEFTFKGAYVATVAGAVPTPTGVSTAAPQNFLFASVETIDGYSSAFETLSYDMGNQVEYITDANSASGIKGSIIVDRRITGSFNPDAEAVGDDDIYASWRAGTTGNIDTGAIGTGAGQMWTIAATRCQYRSLSPGERAGFRTHDVAFDVVSATGASEGASFSLTFT